MKKLFALVAAVLVSVTAAHAQFGIVGGFTFSGSGIDTKNVFSNTKGVALYHAGVSYKFELGPFFAIQPALCYQVKGATLNQNLADIQVGGLSQSVMNQFHTQTGFVELSVGLQGGVDLLAFRPFLLVEPFVGVAVTGKESYCKLVNGVVDGSATNESLNQAVMDVKNKMEFGFGVGAGVEVLRHVQLSLQWFMNLGSLYNDGKIDANNTLATVKAQYKDVRNYQGLKLTLGIFF